MESASIPIPISPLRQRMQHDMMMRGLGPHTQQDYNRTQQYVQVGNAVPPLLARQIAELLLKLISMT